MDAGLGRLNRVVLVMNRRGRARHVVDLIDLDVERKRNVMPDQLEELGVHQMRDVALGPGEEVIDADDGRALPQEPLGQMGAQKSGTAGDQHTIFNMHG